MDIEKDKKISLLLEDLSSLESYINDIFTFSPLPFCFISPAGVILESNPSFEKFSGFTFDEIIGKSVEDLFDNEIIEKILAQTEKKGIFVGQEVDFYPKDKNNLIVQVFAKARKDEKGNFLGYFLGFSDLTKVKKAADNSRRALMNILEDIREARWRAEEEKNKTLAIINNFADGILVLDSKNRFLLINPVAEGFLDIKKENIMNKSVSEIPSLKNLLGAKKKLLFRKEFKIRDDLVLEVTAVPVAREKARIGTLIIFHNVTREKLIENMKTEFVSLAAHQLRTPLSAVKWILRMLLDGEIGKLSKEQKEFLKDGYESNQRMINLVNDLLNVARIEEGRYLYALALTDMEKLISPILDHFKEYCQERGVGFIYKKPGSKLPKVLIDAEKISIAIENIIDNAAKYTLKGGSVTVSLKCDKKNNIEICVKDTGMGIIESQKKNIFSKFFRGANVVRKETDGSGLGLFIAKNIIEAHRGRIWFESEENKGTTFCFTIPIKKK